MSIEVFTSSKTIEWGTPPEIVHAINAAFPLELDVCATPGREQTVAYYCPPLETIGQYKGDDGKIQIDQEFRAAALARALTHPPIAVDALAQDWARDLARLGGCAWMNPPFGYAIKAFIAKAHAEAQRGACVAAIIPSRTGTQWWHSHVEPVRVGKFPGRFEFFKGRISFITRAGDKPAPAPFDMALCIWDGRNL